MTVGDVTVSIAILPSGRVEMQDKKRSQENTFISQAHDRSLLQICVTIWPNLRSVAAARRRACKSRAWIPLASGARVDSRPAHHGWLLNFEDPVSLINKLVELKELFFKLFRSQQFLSTLYT